jgi:pilus assembly protein Flp/PilA
MRQLIDSFRGDETGAAMVEYGLLVALIALVVAAGATTLGTDIKTFFSTLGTNLPAVPAA